MSELLVDAYKRYLSSRVIVYAGRRQIVAETVLLSTTRFETEELFWRLKPRGLTRPSVYRIVSELLEANVIERSHESPLAYRVKETWHGEE